MLLVQTIHLYVAVQVVFSVHSDKSCTSVAQHRHTVLERRSGLHNNEKPQVKRIKSIVVIKQTES